MAIKSISTTLGDVDYNHVVYYAGYQWIKGDADGLNQAEAARAIIAHHRRILEKAGVGGKVVSVDGDEVGIAELFPTYPYTPTESVTGVEDAD